MGHTALFTKTKERLERYGLFSPDTLETVAKVAEAQGKVTSYEDFFRSLAMPKPTLHLMKRGWGVPVVDIPPREKGEGRVIVMHLPMSNPLDENQLYHIATVAACLPTYRVIGFGNPSGEPYKFRAQNRGVYRLFSIAFTRQRLALVAPEIDYLRAQGITAAHHVGYSYGAHKALIESLYLRPNELASVTLVDPVAHPRGLRQLINDFRSTFAPMGEYVNRTEVQSYFDARAAAAKTKHHKGALRRPISIAIGILMARLDFIPFLKSVSEQHPATRFTVAWGSKSELGNDAHMVTSLAALAKREVNVKSMRLKDDSHALANDIHLQASIIYEAIKRAD